MLGYIVKTIESKVGSVIESSGVLALGKKYGLKSKSGLTDPKIKDRIDLLWTRFLLDRSCLKTLGS